MMWNKKDLTFAYQQKYQLIQSDGLTQYQRGKMKAVYFMCLNRDWGYVATDVWDILEEEGYFQEDAGFPFRGQPVKEYREGSNEFYFAGTDVALYLDYPRYHLKCYTYGKKGKDACTPHQIRQDDLYQVVLDDLRRVTHFARKKERQFAAYITRKNSQELRKEITGLQKEVDTMERRVQELTSLFKRLYEDNVLGRITNEQFRILSGDYNTEQKNLEDVLPGKKARLEKLKASASNVDAFIEKAKRFTTIEELTPELLRLFIQRIEIGERAGGLG